MRIQLLAAFAVLATAATAAGKAEPAPLQTLPIDKLLQVAPLLKNNEIVLVESNDKGQLKQLTNLSLVAAPPALVRGVVATPSRYGEFVRNTKMCKVREEPGGTLFHEYSISYTIYSVEGRHRYTFPPTPAGHAAPPVEMYDPDDNGVRHYRFEFFAAGNATLVALYGYTQVPRDGFMLRFLKAAPTFEDGLALIPQLTLLGAVKERAEALAGHPAVELAGRATAAGYQFLLDRGIVALLRSTAGKLSDVSLVDRSSASPAQLAAVAGDLAEWPKFMPTIERATPLGAKNGVAGVEVAQSLPLMSWTTTFATRADGSSADQFGVAGDLRSSRLRWDVSPSGAGAELVLRLVQTYDKSSLVLRQLYKLEPLFEYGVDVGLGLLALKSVRARAEEKARGQATR